MTPPGREQVTAATAALRHEARDWDDQSTAIAAIAAEVAGMEFGRIEAGLFQIIVSPYNDVVRTVADRCREGEAAMREVASTLRDVANTYEQEDLNNAHRIRDLY